jgi:hypothetical protein
MVTAEEPCERVEEMAAGCGELVAIQIWWKQTMASLAVALGLVLGSIPGLSMGSLPGSMTFLKK